MGKGIEVQVLGKQIVIGNDSLMRQYSIQVKDITDSSGTIIHMIVNGCYKGHLVINDEVKKTSRLAIAKLKAANVKKVVMLTGDQQHIAEKTAKDLGIDEFCAQLLPQHKVELVEGFLLQLSLNEKLIFVGDGMNDAPVLSRADIGVAMGGIL